MVYLNPSISFIYGNVFTRIFGKEGIDVENKSEKFKMRYSYDAYSEKNLRVMHVIVQLVYGVSNIQKK